MKINYITTNDAQIIYEDIMLQFLANRFWNYNWILWFSFQFRFHQGFVVMDQQYICISIIRRFS